MPKFAFTFLILLSFLFAAAVQAQPVTFPSIKSQDLNGTAVNLPRDFRGKANLVIFAFKRRQQGQVDTWLPAAKKLSDRYKSFDYYELPAVGNRSRLMKSIIDNGMRSGIRDVDTRGRTITLYTPKKPLMEKLGMPHDRTIYALLLDSRNRVVWRADGTATADKIAALNAAVAAAL